MINIKDNFKYLVVSTGYTSRLVDEILDIEKEIKREFEADCDDNIDGVNCSHCRDRILFIADEICNISLNDELDEILYVQKIWKTVSDGKNSGIIAIRCECLFNAATIINILIKQKYCHFKWTDLVELTVVQDVLVVYFSCESG